MNPDNDAAVNYVMQDVKSENKNTCTSSEFEEQEIFSTELNIKEETNSFIPLCIKSEIDSKDHTIIVGDAKDHNFSRDSSANSEHLPCIQCGFMFLNPIYQKQHQKKCKNTAGSPADRKYTCGACNEEFTEIPDIQQHMVKHTDKRWPICSYCNKVFSKSDHLEAHIRVHTGEKPYSCSKCSKTFCQSSQLNRHMRVHTGEKSYICFICGKAFSHLGYLNYHMRIHDDSYAMFLNPLHQKQHQEKCMNIDGNPPDRKHCCLICGKTFLQLSHLREHMRVHTGEKPYICSICGKPFSKLGNLKYHMRIHDAFPVCRRYE